MLVVIISTSAVLTTNGESSSSPTASSSWLLARHAVYIYTGKTGIESEAGLEIYNLITSPSIHYCRAYCCILLSKEV